MPRQNETLAERIDILHRRRENLQRALMYGIASQDSGNKLLRVMDFALTMLGEIEIEVYAEAWLEYDAEKERDQLAAPLNAPS